MYKLYSLLCLIVTISISELVIYRTSVNEATHKKELLTTLSRSLQNKIIKVVTHAGFAAEAMGIYFQDGQQSPQTLTAIAKKIEKNNAYIDALMVAPNGVVSFVYPYEENKAAMGHDILNDNNRNDGALCALDSDNIVVIGPVKLVQNGKKAIIIRRPIFLDDNSFWGFTIAVIHNQKLMSTIQNELDKYRNIPFSLAGHDPDKNQENVIIHSKNFDGHYNYQDKLKIYNSDWTIQFNWPEKSHALMRAFLYTVSLMLTFCLYFFERTLHKKNNELKKLNRKLLNESRTDTLTGIYNRRAFNLFTKKHRENEKKLNGCIAFLDIDYFKDINDTYGHNVGDEVLKAFSAQCQALIRGSDMLVRWGGEEFLLFMPELDLSTATLVCERLRANTEKYTLSHSNANINFTVSIGVTSSYNGQCGIEQMIERADNALYQAKNNGRNQVVAIDILS
ncbi:sensor domain-containing diguanylate cyclase [Vibrio sinensis]|uniref:diguanylate cyclase n=1 Tax=Vibrio sinensis TaxID=2302434 RepID=A0A3A6Q7S5_9VIBR|nr:sensor domain-containing diguanylate cyclase [Vibrio sinensis]RJX65320.1 sensor domain-containing diguanylate cyclase [Vibrio sinensis]